jgi:excinuclease UvrABC nuclease subunit
MIAKSYALAYEGYWREPNIESLPAKSGVYSVYACTHNRSANTVSITKLIYIGEAINVHSRIACHEKWRGWRRHVGPGQELCFNFAPILVDRERVEAALINHHKPPENSEYVDYFPYPQTTVSTSGANALLSSYFTVHTRQHRTAFSY